MNFKKLFSNIQFNKTSALKIDINLDRVGELIQKRKDKIKKAEEDNLEKVQLCFDNIKNKVDNLMKLHKFVSENDIEVIGDIFFNKRMKPVLVGGVTGFGIKDIWGYYLIFVNNKGISFLDIIDKSVNPFKQADLAVEFCDMFAEYYTCSAYHGIGVWQLDNGTIKIATGQSLSALATSDIANTNTAPCRVKVWKIGKI